MKDAASFDEFYRDTSVRPMRYCYAVTGDRAEAQDVVQEAYTRAWRHWRTVAVHPAPEAWVRLVVARFAADRWILASRTVPPVPPGDTVSVPPPSPVPTVTASPRATPADPTGSATPGASPRTRTADAGSPGRTLPTRVPDRVFLSAAENRYGKPKDVSTDAMLPPLCGARYRSDSAVAERRSTVSPYRTAGAPQTDVTYGNLTHTVTVYRNTGASDFLVEPRAAVRGCPTGTRDGTTYRNRLLTPAASGDDSVLVERTYRLRDIFGKPPPGNPWSC